MPFASFLASAFYLCLVCAFYSPSVLSILGESLWLMSLFFLLQYYWIKLNCLVAAGDPDMAILDSALPFHCSF